MLGTTTHTTSGFRHLLSADLPGLTHLYSDGCVACMTTHRNSLPTQFQLVPRGCAIAVHSHCQFATALVWLTVRCSVAGSCALVVPQGRSMEACTTHQLFAKTKRIQCWNKQIKYLGKLKSWSTTYMLQLVIFDSGYYMLDRTAHTTSEFRYVSYTGTVSITAWLQLQIPHKLILIYSYKLLKPIIAT